MVDPRKSKNSASLDLPFGQVQAKNQKKRACSFAPVNSNAWNMFFFSQLEKRQPFRGLSWTVSFFEGKIYISNKKEAEPSWCFNLVGGFNPFEKY